MKRQAGFTLMEVLVALAVLAIALGAIIQSVSSSANTAGYLRDKTLAQWVASNKMAEIQSLVQVPGGGKGTEEMAGHEWHWEARVTDKKIAALEQIGMKMENVKHVVVQVKRNRGDKQVLATLEADVGLPDSGS